jgi:ParB family chromosome partitioning protein
MTKTKNSTGFNLKGRTVLSGFISEPEQDQKAKLSPVSEEPAAQWIQIRQIEQGSFQPRQFFSQGSIDSLAKSFGEKGFKGALNVRPRPSGKYELIAGERRWRAAKQAGLQEVRCIVDEYSDEEALEFALVENLQREDLSKLEETEGILQLIEMKLDLDRNQVVKIIRTEGHPDRTTRSDVAPSQELQKIEQLLAYFNVELQTFRTKNLRTLSLPQDLKEAHLQQNLPYSCALELNKVKDAKLRESLLEEVIAQKLSFREVKQQVRELKQSEGGTGGGSQEMNGLLERLQGTVKRAKRSGKLLQKAQKRKRLAKLVAELEALLEEGEVGS